MTLFSPIIRTGLVVAGLALATLSGAWAETFPARPLRLVVPFSPGGAADILGRAVSERMSRSLGRPVVVENKPGAGGAIAAEYVARSAPDGYTMLLGGTTALVFYPLLQTKQSYNAQQDFTGIGMLASSQLVLVVNAKAAPRTAADLAKTSKAGAMNYGSSGNGTSMNIAGELFKSVSGADLLHVPYKGSPPALNALMSGEVNSVFDLVASAKPLIEGGKLKPLAVLGATRSSILPDVPTLQEQGYKGFDFSVRYALLAPRGTPAEIVARLNAELNTALRDPALSTQLRGLALDVMPGPADAVMAYARAEIARLGPIVKANGIRLD